MHVTRNATDTSPGPSEWFTGSVYIDPVATPSGSSHVSASSVHFTPGARTAWHTHPNGQTIFVLEGVGLCQRLGGPYRTLLIKPGQEQTLITYFKPGAWKWACVSRHSTVRRGVFRITP